MSSSSLIERLPTSRVAWGRCFSVVAAEIDHADDALETLLCSSECNALLELEAFCSDRAQRTHEILSNPSFGRPTGPYSSIVLDALSIASQRIGQIDEAFGSWTCYLTEEGALEAARLRWGTFLESTTAAGLEVKLHIYTARVGGTFVDCDDVVRHLRGTRSANDPVALADEISLLREAGIDGILFRTDKHLDASAVILRGSAVTHMRPVREFSLHLDEAKVCAADCTPQIASASSEASVETLHSMQTLAK